jgi:hypothetical protein
MPLGSGISAQFGYAAESTWGTSVTPDHFVDFNDEGLSYAPTWLEGMGLHAGGQMKRLARLNRSRYSAGGNVTMELATNKLGLLLKHMLGSSGTATLISGAAYKQIHQLGSSTGLGLTLQVGRPQTDGTVKPFTYPGSKPTGWSIAVSDGENATLSVDFDAKDEVTSTGLASASYVAAANVFNFSQVTAFKIGGTASTTTGVISVASGVSVASICRSFTLTGARPLANERYGLGNAGAKAEQIENGFTTITGSLGAEFSTQAEFYDLFKTQAANGTGTALQLTMTGAAVVGGGGNYTFDIILPAVKFKNVDPDVNGPDIVSQTVDFEVYDDGTNNPIQITYISSDTAI